MRAVCATCVAIDSAVMAVGTASMRASTMIVGSLALVAAVIAIASASAVREDGAQ